MIARVFFEICFCYGGADRIEMTKCEKGGIEGKSEKSRQPSNRHYRTTKTPNETDQTYPNVSTCHCIVILPCVVA